jgi:methionine sulfoxide reductase heme-binding subunit
VAGSWSGPVTVVAASAFGSNPLWYATRSTGIIAFVLLTLAFAFGLAATKRALASRAWPRFAGQQMHRNLSLLALGFLVVHIVTTLADSYVHVGWWSWIVPGASGYRTLWVALGTVSFDLILLLTVTSLLRDRMSGRSWRAIHWAAYAVWPLAFLHFLNTGTDAAHDRWGLYLDVICLMALGVAAATRWLTGDEPTGPIRSTTGAVR